MDLVPSDDVSSIFEDVGGASGAGLLAEAVWFRLAKGYFCSNIVTLPANEAGTVSHLEMPHL